MLCREIIAVCSQIHTKHINTLCGRTLIVFNNAMCNVLLLLYAMYITAPCFIVTLRYAEHDGHAQHNSMTVNNIHNNINNNWHAVNSLLHASIRHARSPCCVVNSRLSFQFALCHSLVYNGLTPASPLVRRTFAVAMMQVFVSLNVLNFVGSPKMQRCAKFYARVITWRHMTHCWIPTGCSMLRCRTLPCASLHPPSCGEILEFGSIIPLPPLPAPTNTLRNLCPFLIVTNNENSFIHSLLFSLEGRAWQEPEPSRVTGIDLAHCILSKFLGVVCHCFAPPLDVPT